MPPIDRQYTFQFFTAQKQVSQGERTAFHECFTLICEIGRKRRESIDVILRRGGFMATSSSKVIDNAIVGFALTQRTKD